MTHGVTSTGTHWPTPLANVWPPCYVADFGVFSRFLKIFDFMLGFVYFIAILHYV